MGISSKSKKNKEVKNKTPETDKPRKKRPHEYSPVIGMNGYKLEKGDNAKITGVCLKTFNLPKIDVNDYEAVEKRLKEYFEIYMEADMKPTVSGMAMALGHDRQWLYSVVNNYPAGGRGNLPNYPKNVTDLIKSAYSIMENQWENYMLSGKLNPVSGIFFGTNHYKYQNRAEHVITPNNQEEKYSAESIKERYLIDEKK